MTSSGIFCPFFGTALKKLANHIIAGHFSLSLQTNQKHIEAREKSFHMKSEPLVTSTWFEIMEHNSTFFEIMEHNSIFSSNFSYKYPPSHSLSSLILTKMSRSILTPVLTDRPWHSQFSMRNTIFTIHTLVNKFMGHISLILTTCLCAIEIHHDANIYNIIVFTVACGSFLSSIPFPKLVSLFYNLRANRAQQAENDNIVSQSQTQSAQIQQRSMSPV